MATLAFVLGVLCVDPAAQNDDKKEPTIEKFAVLCAAERQDALKDAEKGLATARSVLRHAKAGRSDVAKYERQLTEYTAAVQRLRDPKTIELPMLPRVIRAGDIGRIASPVIVLQVYSKDAVLVHGALGAARKYKPGEVGGQEWTLGEEITAWVEGIDTSSLVDNAQLKLVGAHAAVGTKELESGDGSTKTVMRFRPFDTDGLDAAVADLASKPMKKPSPMKVQAKRATTKNK